MPFIKLPVGYQRRFHPHVQLISFQQTNRCNLKTENKNQSINYNQPGLIIGGEPSVALIGTESDTGVPSSNSILECNAQFFTNTLNGGAIKERFLFIINFSPLWALLYPIYNIVFHERNGTAKKKGMTNLLCFPRDCYGC